jgi:branched-subunit amino acid transport protein AzlD
VKQQNIHQQAAVPRLDEQTRLGFHVQACYGAATCEAALALLIDPQLKHPDTLQALVSCLHQLKDALSLVLPYEALYWLTLNGTLHIYTLAKRMLTSGFVAQMLPFLVFCVKSLESHVIFSTAKYLPWRTQLYITLCYAYCDVHAYDVSKGVVQVSGLRDSPACASHVLQLVRYLSVQHCRYRMAGRCACTHAQTLL